MKRFSFFVAILAGSLMTSAAWMATSAFAAPGDNAPPAAAPQKQPQEVTDAIELFKKGDYDGALKLLKEAAKKNPDLPPAQIMMAQFFSQANIPMGVRSALEQAVMELPDDPQAYIILADAAVRERRVTEAILLYERANSLLAAWKGSGTKKQAMQAQVYNGMSVALGLRGDWAGAQKHLEAWLKMDPKSAPALQELARCLFQQRNPQGSLEKLREAAKIDSNALLPETALAQYFARAGDQENAKKWLVAALTAAPRDLRTRLVAAQWAWELGQLDEARKQASGALQLDPRSLDAKILCGVIALFQKDYKAAELYFESAHLQAPKNFAASNNLALALVEQKDKTKKQRALEYAEANAKQYPKVGDALSTYGWVLYKVGRLEEAENALRAAAGQGGFGPDAAFYLASVLADRGQDADAKQLLQRALESPGLFPQRDEAKALLEKLQK